jgi:hypothetical protein
VSARVQRFFQDTGSTVGHPTPGTVSYINESGEPEEVTSDWLDRGRTSDGRPIRDEIAQAIDTWSRGLGAGLGGPNNAAGTLFFRNRYSLTLNVYDQMLQCQDAVEFDEILSSTCDATEGLAFTKMSFECTDDDQEDVWNQLAADIDLDSRMREMWREMFKVSQFYVAIDWGEKIYKVRNKTVPAPDPDDYDLTVNTPDMPKVPGAEDLHPTGVPMPGPKKRARRKQFAVTVPKALSILDPTKVLPVGQLMFGRERFCYIASLQEHEAFLRAFRGIAPDPLALALFEGQYNPTDQERHQLSQAHLGPANATYLWLFKQDCIFRHTETRAQYERFAALRLKSVLPILDIKAHLRASDRATLIGATNFIVVLKRGSEKFPARASEVEQLREQARVVARMPILVGDHRLSVEIITPKTDFVLDSKRYDMLDERLIMRGLHTFRTGGRTAGASDTQVIESEVIARGIESRRHEMSRTLEDQLWRLTIDKNPTVFTETPKLSFHPKRVIIAINADVVNAILKLRDRGDISRQTSLEEFQYDQETEFIRRRREKGMDKTFQSSVPFSSPDSNPFTAGTQGGRPPGSADPGAPAPPPTNSGA